MVNRILSDKRPIGPFFQIGNDFRWAVDDEAAHHIYQSTLESNSVGFGPFTISLQTFMDFFPDRDRSSSLNNWYFTRDSTGIPDVSGDGEDFQKWLQVGSPVELETLPNPRAFTTDILFDENMDPNPEATKVTSQQYTVHGALFTYEFDQDWGEKGSGFVRVPVPRELADEAKQLGDGTKFEYFEFQNREYRPQFAEVGTPKDRDLFFHPHFRTDDITSPFDITVFIDKAFNIMEKGVRIERT